MHEKGISLDLQLKWNFVCIYLVNPELADRQFLSTIQLWNQTKSIQLIPYVYQGNKIVCTLSKSNLMILGFGVAHIFTSCTTPDQNLLWSIVLSRHQSYAGFFGYGGSKPGIDFTIRSGHYRINLSYEDANFENESRICTINIKVKLKLVGYNLKMYQIKLICVSTEPLFWNRFWPQLISLPWHLSFLWHKLVNYFLSFPWWWIYHRSVTASCWRKGPISRILPQDLDVPTCYKHPKN